MQESVAKTKLYGLLLHELYKKNHFMYQCNSKKQQL